MKFKQLFPFNSFVILTYLVAFLLVYKSTLVSLLHRWTKYDETYSHGFLVLFITCYLIYEKRREISMIAGKPALYASVPLMIFSFIWAVAYYVDIIIIQQLLLPVIALSVIALTTGIRNCKKFLFPLGFLYFAIPIWDYLNSGLLSLTVSVTGFVIRASGLTALIEGDTITLPAGRILVAGGCSGLSYFIVCMALSILASHLFIKTTNSKYLLIGAGMITALLVNWIRVYSIVAIGYYTNMESKLIYDHELYGWLLFLFFFSPIFISSYRSNSSGRLVEHKIKDGVYNNVDNNHKIRYYIGWFLAFLFSIMLPHYLSTVDLVPGTNNFQKISIDFQNNDWHELPTHNKDIYIFSHSSLKPDKLLLYNLINTNEEVALAVALYQRDNNRKDFLPYNAALFDPDKWFLTKSDNISIKTKKETIKVRNIEIRQYIGNVKRMIWYWYVIGGEYYNNKYLAKLSELYALLQGRGDAEFIYIQSDCNSECDIVNKNIKTLITELDKSISTSMYSSISAN
ncbi:MAG: exosortase C-terminal domain/associated protein EpsI [Candidatus Scalindua sp.]